MIQDTLQAVQQAHTAIVETVLKKAKDLAAQERPANKAETQLYSHEMRAKYQGLVRLVNAWLLPLTNSTAGAVDTQLAMHESSNIEKEIAVKQNQLNVHRMDHPEARGSISVPLKALLVVLMTLVVLGSESLWLSGAFMVTGESKIRATWIGLGVTLLMGALAHTTVYAIRKFKRRQHKVAAIVVSLLIALVVYYVLGTLRAKFLNEVLEYGDGLMTSPWMFAVLSLAVYVAIGAFSLFFFPSLDEIEAYRTHRKAKRELRSKEEELAALNAERKAMPGRFSEKIEARAGIVESSAALKRTICEMHKETHLLFAQTNALRRVTTPPPELFNNPPDLDLDDR